MKIQEILFQVDGIEIPEEMLFRGNAMIKDGMLEIKQGESVSFDTYFNMFSAYKWVRHTTVDSIFINVAIQGKGDLQIIGIKSSIPYDEKVIENIKINNASMANVMINIPFQSYDYLFFNYNANKLSYIQEAYFESRKPCANDINLACCFCTYKREKELFENIERLRIGLIKNQNSILYNKVDIYIADNGNTIDSEKYSGSERIHLFPNRNHGGTAGFTRCLIEAMNKGYSNYILMDDDAVIISEVIERTAAFLMYIKNEQKHYIIGGAMLSKENPSIQIENSTSFIKGITERKYSDLNLKQKNEIIMNGRDDAGNYNGWFYCCIPCEYINCNNLPFPFFIHGDDIEYGIRNGGNVIVMNGIAVWHPDPRKKKQIHMRYYDNRNFMIIMSIQDENTRITEKMIKKRIFDEITKLVLSWDYEGAEYSIKGLEDFLKGVTFFRGLDAEKYNNDIMSLISKAKYKYNGEIITDRNRYRKSFKGIDYFFKVIDYLLPARHECIFYDQETRIRDRNTFGYRNLIVVDRAKQSAVIQKKDRKRAIKIYVKLFKIWKKYNLRTAIEEWRDNRSTFENAEYWFKYLGL